MTVGGSCDQYRFAWHITWTHCDGGGLWLGVLLDEGRALQLIVVSVGDAVLLGKSLGLIVMEVGL